MGPIRRIHSLGGDFFIDGDFFGRQAELLCTTSAGLLCTASAGLLLRASAGLLCTSHDKQTTRVETQAGAVVVVLANQGYLIEIT